MSEGDNGVFDPASANGKEYIVSLVLPDAATGIREGMDENNPTFKDFGALKSVSGENVGTVGNLAFIGCTSLETVSFPAAVSIGSDVFNYCVSLETVSLPAAVSIGSGAFQKCFNLETVSLPKAESIGSVAFTECTSLTTVSLPAAEDIGDNAFNNCSSLETVSLPAAVPTLGKDIFYRITTPQNVKVLVPEGANTEYDIDNYDNDIDSDVNWGNGFRGGGWKNSQFVSGGSVNTKISLSFDTY
jgi:hypothetical protein